MPLKIAQSVYAAYLVASLPRFVTLFFLCSLGEYSGPSEGPQSRMRMDSGPRTMYSLHLGTCSFTRVRHVPKGDTTGGIYLTHC